MVELPIKTNEDFVYEITELVWRHDMSFMDAIIKYCTDNDVEIETAAAIASKNGNLKASLQREAEDLNFLKQGKSARLPGI